MKFTFKTEREKGAYASFYPPIHFIKFNKCIVGSIDGKTYNIRLMVVKKDIMEDGNPNCTWKWITLSIDSFTSLKEAKEWLNANILSIREKYQLHLLEQ